jgi:hypothetical protein
VPDYGRGKRPLSDPDRRERQMREDRDAILAAIAGTAEQAGFTDRAIRAVVAKGERTARGSRMASEAEGRRSKGDVSDPTESAATAREMSDKVGRWIGECAALLNTAADCMADAWGRLQLAMDAPESEWAKQVRGDDCRACDRNVSRHRNPNDRLRDGYCPACYEAWRRAMATWTDEGLPDAPDRVAFERERRQRSAALAEEESA